MASADPVRVDTKRLQWLLERVTAGADWISDAQVEAFGRRPEMVPIMPSSHIVLRSVRLLESYGMDENGKPFISPVTNGPELPVVQVATNRAGNASSWRAARAAT